MARRTELRSRLDALGDKEIDELFELTEIGSHSCREEGPHGVSASQALAEPTKPRVDRVERTTHQQSRNGQRIDRIVIHYTTSRSIEGTISWFKSAPPGERTSAHYIVGRDGVLVQMVDDSNAAWHARAVNKRSIGIEHVAAPGDKITEKQAKTSAALIAWLMHEYEVAKINVIPHRCVGNTNCCGDLFADFGGGRDKDCEQQKAALHAWMSSVGIAGAAQAATAPASTLSNAGGAQDAAEIDRSIRGDRLGDEPDADGAPGAVVAANPAVSSSRVAQAMAEDIMRKLDIEAGADGDDVTEFQDVGIDEGFDVTALAADGVERAAERIEQSFGQALESFDYIAFEDLIRDQLGIVHFAPIEFLFLGGQNEAGKCAGLNRLPDRSLWVNIGKTAQMLDAIRAELGAPIRILSAYRNRPYNECISGAGGSHHMKFNAIDWRCSTGTVAEWRAAARRVRSRQARFSGGVGYYPGLKFIHIDTRGFPADWTGS